MEVHDDNGLGSENPQLNSEQVAESSPVLLTHSDNSLQGDGCPSPSIVCSLAISALYPDEKISNIGGLLISDTKVASPSVCRTGGRLSEDKGRSLIGAILSKVVPATFSTVASVAKLLWRSGTKAKEEKIQQFARASPLTCIKDHPRKEEKLTQSPSGTLAAITDSLRRILLLDTPARVVVRLWKGYRDASCSFMEMLVNKDNAPSSSNYYGAVKSDYCLCPAIHAPWKGIIEMSSIPISKRAIKILMLVILVATQSVSSFGQSDHSIYDRKNFRWEGDLFSAMLITCVVIFVLLYKYSETVQGLVDKVCMDKWTYVQNSWIGQRLTPMEYDDNDIGSQNLQLCCKELPQSSHVLSACSLSSYDIDDDLQGDIRFDSFVEHVSQENSIGGAAEVHQAESSYTGDILTVLKKLCKAITKSLEFPSLQRIVKAMLPFSGMKSTVLVMFFLSQLGYVGEKFPGLFLEETLQVMKEGLSIKHDTLPVLFLEESRGKRENIYASIAWGGAAQLLADKEENISFGLYAIWIMFMGLCLLVLMFDSYYKHKYGSSKVKAKQSMGDLLDVGPFGTLTFEGKRLMCSSAVKVMSAQLFDYKAIEGNLRSVGELASAAKACLTYDPEEDEDHFGICYEIGVCDLGKALESFPSDIKSNLMRQVANGVKDLHEKNISHRGLSPMNVLIMKDEGGVGRFKVVLRDTGMDSEVIHKSLRKFIPSDHFLGWQLPDDFEKTVPDKVKDIFSLGCLLFYYLTGRHPYGQVTERIMNMIGGRAVNYDEIKGMKEAMDLLQDMIDINLVKRNEVVDIVDVCSHPFFWGRKEQINFISKCSDKFHADRISGKYNAVTVDLESEANIILPPLGWQALIDGAILIPALRRRPYDHSVENLLRFIRNHHRHFDEYSPSIQQLLGSQENIYEYFEKHFPMLLIVTYKTVKHHCGNDDWFIKATSAV